MDTKKESNNIKKWKLCNRLLNSLREAKGLPLVPYTDNPYWQSNIKNKKECSENV